MNGTFTLKTLAIVLAIWALPSVVHGAQQKFKLEDVTVTMDVPEQWMTAQDVFGMPLMVLGPMEDDKRPVVAVMPSGKIEGKFGTQAKKEEAAYKAGRQTWLKERSGRWIASVPYKEFKSPGTSGGHSLGYRYQISGEEFVENSHYVVCKGNLYHVKSLLTAEQEEDNSPTIDKMIASFSCE